LGHGAGGVGGGELEAVEQGHGTFGFEAAGGQRVDDLGESDLDGVAVFEWGELNVLAGEEIALHSRRVTIAAVALVETVVVVAPVSFGEGWGFALASIGPDVTAEWILHHGLLEVGYPPGVLWLKVEWLQRVSGFRSAKVVQP
jgi:uncharacterized membrane protein